MEELRLLKNPFFWLVCLLVLIWVAIFQLPDSQLHLVFCDVGQGDAALISYRSAQVLVDGGPDSRVLECLSDHLPFWDRRLEMVVLTHPEADHFTGLIEVLGRYEVGQIMVNSVINDSGGFWEFHWAVLAEGTKIYSPQTGDRLKLGPMQFLVLWPKEKLGDDRVWHRDTLLAHESNNLRKPPEDSGGFGSNSLAGVTSPDILGAASYSGKLNETSVVLKLSFGNFDALLTGDISSDIEKRISWSTSQLGSDPVEVLKVAHHGSKYSTSEEFLQKVRPELAVVSVGKNPWSHPTKEVLGHLSDLAIKLLRTDQEGEVEIVADGQKWGLKK